MDDVNRVGLRLLRHILFETNLKVLFITGAGISVKSGVPLYRSGGDDEEYSDIDSSSIDDESSDSGAENNESPVTAELRNRGSDEAYVAISGDEREAFQPPKRSPPLEVSEPALPPDEARAKEERKRRHRRRSSAIWSKKLTTMGQRLAFLSNPRAWYRYFWFDTHHVESFLQAAPNATHISMALLCEKFPARFKIITQNVDRLHQRGGCPLESLIEVHGRIGVYRCTDLKKCEYGTDRTLYPEDLMFMSPEEEAQMPRRAAGRDIDEAFLIEARRESIDLAIHADFPMPCCPKCRSVVMPMTLLFDEAYGTHQFFQIFQAQDWIMDADVFVFAGTSFSVHFTEMVLSRVRQNSHLAFHLNTQPNNTGVFGGFDDYLRPKDRRSAHRSTSPPTITSKEAIHLNWDSGSDQEDVKTTQSGPIDDFNPMALTRPMVCEIVMPAEEAMMRALPGEYRLIVDKRVREAEIRKLRRQWEARD